MEEQVCDPVVWVWLVLGEVLPLELALLGVSLLLVLLEGVALVQHLNLIHL